MRFDMDSSMGAGSAAQPGQSQQVTVEVAKWWWAWLVAGILWIVASIFILQFREGSVALVGIILGILFLVAGLQEFVLAAISDSWKWLWITFGVILVIGGLYALFNPVRTFAAIASMLGFLFVLIGVGWMVEAFVTKAANPLWWLGLIAGIMMLMLGFWAAGQFFVTQAYALLVFAGIWALVHGITDIIKAFAVKRLGEGTGPTAAMAA